jgi:PAS domain-containing protein
MRDSEDQHTVVAMTHGARVLAGAPPDSRPQPVREVRSGGDLQTDQAMRLALLAAIVDSSDDAIVGKTLEGRVLSWNAAAMRIFGYQPAEVIGKSITMIIPPELRGEEERDS